MTTLLEQHLTTSCATIAEASAKAQDLILHSIIGAENRDAALAALNIMTNTACRLTEKSVPITIEEAMELAKQFPTNIRMGETSPEQAKILLASKIPAFVAVGASMERILPELGDMLGITAVIIGRLFGYGQDEILSATLRWKERQ